MITLTELKAALRISHNDEDAELQRKLDAATCECMRFLNTNLIPLEQDVINGIVLIVQADYEGEPLRRDEYRANAQSLWNPYRANVGF